MRRGLLGKGAWMIVTSQATRTSPVTRGKVFLETFLGVSPPSPPPVVPDQGAGAGQHRQQQGTDHARAHGDAPCEPDLLELPQSVRADRAGARELRRGRRLAAQGRRPADRPHRSAGRRHEDRWRGEPAGPPDAELGAVRACRGGKAAHLRAGPRRGRPGHAAGAVDRARRGALATIAFRRSCWASSRARRSRTTSRVRSVALQTATH